MSAIKVTTPQSFNRSGKADIFQVSAGVSAQSAIEFAETALEVSKELLGGIVASPSSGSADKAFATRFLIDAALASYRAAGVSP